VSSWRSAGAPAGRRVPVFSTVTGAIVGVAAVCGALVFSASLANLFSRPSLYGVTWDASVQSLGNDTETGIQPAVSAVASDPLVRAWTTGFAARPSGSTGSARTRSQ
jgi:hypothetical protein